MGGVGERIHKNFENDSQQRSNINTQPFRRHPDLDLSHDLSQKREQLQAFKTRFESLHPEEAKRLQYEILPSAQKEAIQERQRKEQTLSKEFQRSRESDNVKTRERTEVREQTKTLERNRALERELSKEIGGFER